MALPRLATDDHHGLVALAHARLQVGQHLAELCQEVEDGVAALCGVACALPRRDGAVADLELERLLEPGQGLVRAERHDAAAELGRRERQEGEHVRVDLVVLVDEDDTVLHRVAPPAKRWGSARLIERRREIK